MKLMLEDQKKAPEVSTEKNSDPKLIDCYHFPRPRAAGHSLFVAEYGDPEGEPLLLIHGTALPFTSDQFRFTTELPLRVICVHQRGVGNSTPGGCVIENSLEDSLGDFEALREHLGIDSWHVYGWSLGSTSSLAYAQKHGDHIASLTLSGVFLATEEEYISVLRGDLEANEDKWHRVSELTGIPLNVEALPQIVENLYQRFIDTDSDVADEAMRVWLGKSEDVPLTPAEQSYLNVSFHYRVNRYFVDSGSLQEEASRLADTPTVIVRGSNDTVVKLEASDRLATLQGKAQIVDVTDDHFFKSDESQSALKEALRSLL